MIIEANSPFNRLPSALNRKQALFLDGIRYCVEMADLAHSRLRWTLFTHTTTLDEPTDNQAEPLDNRAQAVPAAFQDAWSIVDSLQRLRGLLAQMPGIKQNAAELQLFRRQTDAFENLRNGVQHLNNHIDVLVAQNLPAWGVLSWVVVPEDPAGNRLLSSAMIAGTLFVVPRSPWSIRPGKWSNPPSTS